MVNIQESANLFLIRDRNPTAATRHLPWSGFDYGIKNPTALRAPPLKGEENPIANQIFSPLRGEWP